MNQPDRTPPDCFRLEELDDLRSAEGRVLWGVNYYLIRRQPAVLYYLELLFDDAGEALLLTCGEDSLALRTARPEDLLRDAERLQALHGERVVTRIQAGDSPYWRPFSGVLLRQVRLTKNPDGLFLNDAVLFDFGEKGGVCVRVSEDEGLSLSVFPAQG